MRCIRARMPWSAAKRLLRANGLTRKQGWDRTLALVAAGDDQFDEKEQDLRDALEEHLMCGEKLVQLYDLGVDQNTDLQNAALALEIPDGPFKAAYPLLLDEEQLDEHKGHPPILTAVVEYVEGVAVVLASTRYLTTREILAVDELNDEVALELGGFNELIGVRHQRLEAIDVLWLPTDGRYAELRVDHPFGSHQRHGEIALNQARARFNHLLGCNLGNSHVNLFPVIQSLYQAQGDGAMVELGFMVSGSAQKLEKTRRGEQCCREEAYHVGGIGVLDAPIQVYRTSVLWHYDLGNDSISTPEVSINGTSSLTADPDPFIGEMVIRNCVRSFDYEYVRDRIIEHLEANEGDEGGGQDDDDD